MTFDQIVSRVANRLNLTAASAITRIGEEVNDLYKEVTSSLGLESSVRGVVGTTTLLDSRYITFGEDTPDAEVRVIKVLAVFLPDEPVPWNVLGENTFDELRNILVTTWPARRFAVANMGASSVTLFLDATGPDSVTEVHADVLLASETLIGSAQPLFTENFHDVIVYGVMEIELDKMEKVGRAKQARERFERRMSELRMHIADSAYLRIHQGKNEDHLTLNTGPMVIESGDTPSDEILALGQDGSDEEIPLLVDDDGIVLLAP